MARLLLKITFILLIGIFHHVHQIEAANSQDFQKFLKGMGEKISQTAKTIKEYLLELFYRFRSFFLGHSESTHQDMESRGCGYAADNQPTIYNKQKPIIAKIKGGDDALWHTW